MTIRETLESGLGTLNIAYSAEQLEKLLTHISEIVRWNARHNLVKATDDELAIKHTLDSLAGLPVIGSLPLLSNILDIGSGAGFPGIPLALFLPDSRFTLAERLNKRAVFLKNMTLSLGLKNVTVTSADYRTIPERFDVITFRAFVALPDEINEIVQKLSESGKVAAYKGKLSKVNEEIAELRSMGYDAESIGIEIPMLDEERHIILVGKQR
jgi:16S rRNA (guanine527-N7)-methyltransferase